MATESEIKNALATVKYPGYTRDVVSFGLVKEISTKNGAVSVTMQLTTDSPEAAQQIKAESERVLKALPGVNMVHVEVRQQAGAPVERRPKPMVAPEQSSRYPTNRRGRQRQRVAWANPRCPSTSPAASRIWAREVGLLDCDIYGPSIPLMMGIHERPDVTRR